MTCNRMRIVKLVLLCAAVLMLAGTVTAVAGNKLGDVDSDGTVTINDVTAIQMALAELPINGECSTWAADVDGNGDVEISDATLIQMWIAGTTMPYSIGAEPTEPPTEPPTQRPTDADGWGRDVFQP